MPHPEQPSYEELAARNAELLAVVAEQAALIRGAAGGGGGAAAAGRLGFLELLAAAEPGQSRC